MFSLFFFYVLHVFVFITLDIRALSERYTFTDKSLHFEHFTHFVHFWNLHVFGICIGLVQFCYGFKCSVSMTQSFPTVDPGGWTKGNDLSYLID